MAKTDAKKSFLKRLKASFSDLAECEEVDLKESYRLHNKKIKVHVGEYPFQVNLYGDTKSLHVYPERLLNGNPAGTPSGSYIIFDPDRYFSTITGFLPQDFMILQGQTVIAIHNEYANENQYYRKNSYDRKLITEKVTK